MSDTPEHAERLAWGSKMTAEFREGATLRWQNLAKRLREEGIAPEDAAIADFGPDGGGLAAGVLATRDGRVFEFTLALGGREPSDYSGTINDGYVFGFNEMDASELRGIFLDAYDIARDILRVRG